MKNLAFQFKADCFLTENQPMVAVSACLAGQPVRYDGGRKSAIVVQNWLADELNWYPVCPEMRCGLGTPRPPVQLVQLNEQASPLALGRDDPELDITSLILAQADYFIDNDVAQAAISAVLLKSRSPSCGVASTPLLQPHFPTQITNQEKSAGELFSDGLFAGRLRERCPQLLLCEESALNTPKEAGQFLFACRVISEIEHPAFSEHYQALAQSLSCTITELKARLQFVFASLHGASEALAQQQSLRAELQAFIQARTQARTL